MKLWLISQPTEELGFETYDSAVVAAPTEEYAKIIHPSGDAANWKSGYGWCSSPEKVIVKYLGEAVEGTGIGVICASFNDG